MPPALRMEHSPGECCRISLGRRGVFYEFFRLPTRDKLVQEMREVAVVPPRPQWLSLVVVPCIHCSDCTSLLADLD